MHFSLAHGKPSKINTHSVVTVQIRTVMYYELIPITVIAECHNSVYFSETSGVGRNVLERLWIPPSAHIVDKVSCDFTSVSSSGM